MGSGVKATAFLAKHARSSLPAWESEIVRLAQARDPSLFVPPLGISLLPVELPNGRGRWLVTPDVVAVGEPDDFMRMPLTPAAAQAVADAWGMQLLTPKMSKDASLAASVRLEPIPSTRLRAGDFNRGANLDQYARHSRAIDEEISAAGLGGSERAPEILSGLKKDLVIGNFLRPGKVAIFGWFKPNSEPIQPLSTVHYDGYVDYSHGVRLASREVEIDGKRVDLRAALADPKTAGLFSNEGAVPASKQAYPVRRSLSATGGLVLSALGMRK